MYRYLQGTVALLALSAALPALAADYGFQGMRPAYAQDWGTADNPLRFETGLRYWHSWGEQSTEIGGETFGVQDRSHILEGHFRIDDDYTSTFVKGQAGYSFYTIGEYETPFGESPSFEGGQVGYVGGDLGYTPFGNEAFRIGGLLGYQFTRESPDRNRLDVLAIDGINVQSLRLGITAHADINEFFDIEAEAVAVPYAYAHGATAEIPLADTIMSGVLVNRTQTEATGALYGGSAQVMVGFHPTENLTLRLGARASVLTGPSSARQLWWEASEPDSFIYSNAALSGFSLVRYGALAELTGRF